MTRTILLIGAGAIAHHHAAAARLLGDVRLLAADPSEPARRAFAEAFPEAELHPDPETLLRSRPAREGDVAIVAVPPWLHAPMAVRAFEAGYHVLCEKPVARDRAELDAMLAASHAAGRELGDCAVRFNGLPSQARARELIRGGALGPLNVVRMIHRAPRSRPGIEYQPASRWFLSREKSGGGVLMDWSVYDLASLFSVLEPVRVRVASAFLAGIDTAADPPGVAIDVESQAGAAMRLTLAGGQEVPFVYERANGVHAEAHAELAVEGRAGAVSWQWLPPFEGDAAWVARLLDREGQLVREEERLPVGDRPHVHHVPLHTFVARLDGRPSPALEPGRIRFNLDVILAIARTAMSGEATEVALEDERKDRASDDFGDDRLS